MGAKHAPMTTKKSDITMYLFDGNSISLPFYARISIKQKEKYHNFFSLNIIIPVYKQARLRHFCCSFCCCNKKTDTPNNTSMLPIICIAFNLSQVRRTLVLMLQLVPLKYSSKLLLHLRSLITNY